MFMGQIKLETGKMATVIGIFENCYKKKNHFQLLDLEHKQEDLLILMTLLNYPYFKNNKNRYTIKI